MMAAIEVFLMSCTKKPTIGGMEIRNLPAAIHDAMTDPQVAGLLGLNFLSNFRMDIDTQKGMLYLEKK